MTELHEDIILDLLPLYFAGDASNASRKLIDAYFAAHPQFAETMRAAHAQVVTAPGHAGGDEGSVAIKRIRSQLRWRAALIAIGIFCSLSPFSFIYDNGHFRYLMLRDKPAMAAIYACVAVAAWIALFVMRRRTDAD